MSYLKINKQQLINLEYSLGLELLRSNRAGSYANTTIIGSNTRKYHGLLVSPVPNLDFDNHVILSGLDETVIQRGQEFRLGLRKYEHNNFDPKGHKYALDFELDPIPAIIYRVGGVKLKKETLLVQNEERVLIRYTLLEAQSPTSIRLHPFLAFRNVHQLSKENLYANTRSQHISNGIKIKLYEGYPYLHLQINKKAEFVSVPDWYRNIEYIEEQKRGYDFREDLFVPGFFEFSIKKGESVIFSGGLKEVVTTTISRNFAKEIATRVPRDSFENNLKNAAQQFLVNFEGKTEIMAGYPWYGRGGRDTFIALPGLLLSQNDKKTYRAVLETMSNEMLGPLFPTVGKGAQMKFDAADSPLWFIWAVQQLLKTEKSKSEISKAYWPTIKIILDGFKKGTQFNIHLAYNNLIWQGESGMALTWMDGYTTQGPVTPRNGFAVEVNALWYNAVSFALDIAKRLKDSEFTQEWKEMPEQIQLSFIRTFWNKDRKYLADYANDLKTDWSVRPNMLIAASLPYSMLKLDQIKSMVDIAQKELLTPRGLRTLSPQHPDYKGIYSGDPDQRDKAFHQGTSWPWLLGPFVEAYLKVYKLSGLNFVKKLFQEFEEEISKNALGTISQVYDGDPPHFAGGAVSYAMSVGELLRIKMMIDQLEAGSEQ